MDTEAVQPQEALLTVNEQVIVMSGHETIRVLEVGVDAPLPAEEDRKALEMPPGEVARGSPGQSSPPGSEDIPGSTQSSCGGEAPGKTLESPSPSSSPSAVPSAGTFSHATSQQPQPLAPLAPQYCRSSGRSAGAGCVDISYSNGRCPPRIDGRFSYRGSFQSTHSQSASRRRAEHIHGSPGAASPAAAGCGPAPRPAPAPRCLRRQPRPAPNPATAQRCARAARHPDPHHCAAGRIRL
uniref:POU class 6 homeobox 1 n=1 Tax=Amazona collaria TaxID=241587 RepID=A0A8B9F7M8_9PSIT